MQTCWRMLRNGSRCGRSASDLVHAACVNDGDQHHPFLDAAATDIKWQTVLDLVIPANGRIAQYFAQEAEIVKHFTPTLMGPEEPHYVTVRDVLTAIKVAAGVARCEGLVDVGMPQRQQCHAKAERFSGGVAICADCQITPASPGSAAP